MNAASLRPCAKPFSTTGAMGPSFGRLPQGSSRPAPFSTTADKSICWGVEEGASFGRYTFVDQRGSRCPATGNLEFDHIDGFALTHLHDEDRITLRCRPHNQHAAEKIYGRAFMGERGRYKSRPVPGRDAARQSRPRDNWTCSSTEHPRHRDARACASARVARPEKQR